MSILQQWTLGLSGVAPWTPLEVPSALTASVISDTRVDLTWMGGLDVSLEMSADGLTFAEIITVNEGVNAYSNTELTAGNRYYYRVRSYKDGDYSSYSNIVHETTFLRKDLFTGVDGTHLHDHTPDVGGAAAWVSPTNMSISGNKLVSTGALAFYYGLFESGKTDIDITVDMTIPDVSDYESGICVRYQDATHNILCYILRAAAGVPSLTIGYRHGGGPTTISTVPIAHEAITDKFRVLTSGRDIFVFWKDLVNPILTGTSDQFTDKTQHGLFMVGATGTISVVFDNLIIIPFRIPVIKQAGIALSFDDPWFDTMAGTPNLDTWITANNALKSFGWKASFAVSTLSTNTVDSQDIADIISFKTRLETLIADGHTISNHTYRHNTYNTYISAGHTKQEYYDNCIVPLQTIFQNVLGFKPKAYRYSNWYGESDCVESNLMIAGGFEIIEDNLAVYPVDMSVVCYKGFKNPTRFDIAPYTGEQFTDAQIIALLDYARDNRQIIGLFSHTILPTGVAGTYQVSLARMEIICQYVIDNGMKFYTLQNEINDIFV